MGFLDLFVVASMPVLKVLLVTGLGLYLALDHVDVMGESTRKQLNRVSCSVLISWIQEITEQELLLLLRQGFFK